METEGALYGSAPDRTLLAVLLSFFLLSLIQTHSAEFLEATYTLSRKKEMARCISELVTRSLAGYY